MFLNCLKLFLIKIELKINSIKLINYFVMFDLSLKFILTNIGIIFNSVTNNTIDTNTITKTNVSFILDSNSFIVPPSFHTVLTLANMSQLAYEMDTNIPIENSTIRAFLFSDPTNSFNVISIKGTTPPFISGNSDNYLTFQRPQKQAYSYYSDVSKNDKLNDNLFFSCCFYKQSNLFYDHCDYHFPVDSKTCLQDCYKNSSSVPHNYHVIAFEIINKIKDIIDFDNSQVIFTGHSLGGVVATFLGLYFNKTTVTFETPGERHYLKQLFSEGDWQQLINRNDLSIYHFGHNADPIVNGNCGNTCWLMGYNIDTRCHIGHTCIFNSKIKLGLSEFIWRHRLSWVINWIIPYWETEFPDCIYNATCDECQAWSYV